MTFRFLSFLSFFFLFLFFSSLFMAKEPSIAPQDWHTKSYKYRTSTVQAKLEMLSNGIRRYMRMLLVH